MKWLYLLASLSFLILFHEFGHYITAKWFKVRVEKFYLFFDAWFSLAKKKIGETEYGIGWLPLGGYVKLSGMIDESMDKSFVDKEPEPWEFRSKPAWQRLIIMLGGIIVNFLIAWIIYTALFMSQGKNYIKNEDVKYGIEATELGEKYGLQDGDKLVSYKGKKIDIWDDGLALNLLTDKNPELTVNRGGKNIDLTFDKQFKSDFLEMRVMPFEIFIPSKIAKISEGGSLENSKFKAGDRLLSIDGKEVTSLTRGKEILSKIKTPGTTVTVTAERNGQIITDQITPTVTTRHTFIRKLLNKPERHIRTTLGYENDMSGLTYSNQSFNLLQAIPAGWNRSWSVLSDYASQFKFIFTKQGITQLGGIGTFAQQFQGINWVQFWSVTAWLSLILAFMNLLPIPALDGGHAIICIVEMITGKKPNEKFLEKIQLVGFLLLVSLMLYANGLDLIRG